ncbi:MAG: hypothetical protein ACYC2J_11210 [Acidithiobacillus ferrooxidans]
MLYNHEITGTKVTRVEYRGAECKNITRVRVKRDSLEQREALAQSRHVSEQRMNALFNKAKNLANKQRSNVAGDGIRSSCRSGDGTNSVGGDDTSDGDGEPPHRPLLLVTPAVPLQLYSYQSASSILCCAVQTLYNKVNSGAIPTPLKTLVGPRFTQDHIQQIILGATSAAAPALIAPKRSAGRPRIALITGKGGAK